MDFSRLHIYTPPQCVPENTGYTYALSSSYSSDALDFETEHKLDPVFDSPRMSRRSLRLATTACSTEGGQAGDADSRLGSTASLKDRTARTAKQHRSASKLAFSVNRPSRQVAAGQSSGLQGAACLRPPVLDESLIREQTKVDHFWGLDDDGDLKGGNKAVVQGNGKVAADAAWSNGYTCRACTLLSERQDTLPAHGASSRVYSRDRSQKRGASLYVDRILWLATYTSSSFSSFLVQLFQVVLMKLNYESENSKLKSYESKDRESESFKSESHDSQARSDPCGRRTVTEFLREDGGLSVNGESCDDYRGTGTEHLETHTATSLWSPRTERAAGTTRPTLSRAGHAAERALRRIGAAGRSVSQAVWSALWLAAAAPGTAASGMFWWLGSGWYQFVTLISWLNVFLLTRCLRDICKFLILLIPLLLLLGAGLSLRGQDGFLSLLPVFNWTHTLRTQRVDDPKDMFTPETSHLSQPPEGAAEASPWRWMSEVERQVTSLSGQCQSRDEKLRELTASLQKLQVRVDQMDDGGAGVSSLVTSVVGQHLKDLGASGLLGSQADAVTSHHEQLSRISDLEDLLGKLAGKLEAIQRELEQTKLRTESAPGQEQHLLSMVAQLERELELLRSDVAAWRPLRSSCEEAHTVLGKVDAQVRETVRLLLSNDQQDGSLDWLLQKLSAQFVSKADLQALLRELELQILKNITHHISVTRQGPTSEAIMAAVTSEGTSGITEAQARVIVNNALKLYSQDKTGMVDFALESGGGSILSTRCSETHETKTALISLFGIPLWYFSQSPRVVIQPDIYPGNCWAFKGSQGYLVVRLSMEIHPTSFTLEHIPKTLSPTGNITSAPKDFSVYGLENEYQEEGQLLGQFMFDQEGESLQTFPVPKRPERAFQIVELRIFSNWGHPEYTCLYRFRVHGDPVK
ncbi:PREDICTED: SUN domain-containing protein 1 isoform X1 [Myotis brandtii]|uniref:SUN domain-containing protein 1 isoform X1 n=1 Tax=Myotis brandtii TaxID=109478 RepID=UPI0003BBE1F4|nr:PREDICTED: SUN domain-containing protein 1 isoform X1 [Myotis brandtii]XP_005860895.1 PREDICTED: SUN domain-containing protein 1 isoform X1 [Myotis brandtii]XP_005860896.1 PREDICTED: SUN domain-containing protein 1 isoform X1 [Myotis brandtii]XP_014390737.1 PREDICTED: SUN domain-containing protein 1 isoform X1 [Myotis brandtii]XP_014390738.1 PREDICTED: SUN domain-containing protein 1 isoform X1 [Myotis brandtii]XP_014390739.1 PREDICTED: SUN domain-containing protein 1 isoform X1 [Myotis bra